MLDASKEVGHLGRADGNLEPKILESLIASTCSAKGKPLSHGLLGSNLYAKGIFPSCPFF